MKKLVFYAPLTFDRIPSKTFRSFTEMTKPSAQKQLAENYGIEMMDPFICDKFPIDYNRNYAFDIVVNKLSADYVMCCDMDQVFKKDSMFKLLDTLLENPEAGAVTGVYFTKTPPHRAVVGKYSPWNANLDVKKEALRSQGFIDKEGSQTLYFKHLQYFDVVQPVDVFGLGCILIKTEIFAKLEQPFCKYVNPYTTGLDYTFQGHSEDMWLCSQMKQAGIKTLVNPKVMVGHVTEKVICGNESDE